MILGNLLAQDHSVGTYFLLLQLQRYKVEVSHRRQYDVQEMFVCLLGKFS